MFGFLDLEDGVAVRHQHGVLTFREFGQLLGVLSARLDDIGLEPGDRVAAILPNSLELLAAYYACLLNGLVLVPINERLTPREAQRTMGHCEPRCLITTPRLAAEYGDLEDGRSLSVLPLERVHAWVSDAERELPVPAPRSWAPDHPAVLFYTSGSTGAPKGALYTHGTLIDNARVYGRGLGITKDDHSVLCHCMASNFVFAQLTVPLLDLGGTVEVVDFGSVEQTLDAVEGGATFLSLIPWFGFQLVEAGRARTMIPNRLRVSAVVGDRVPPSYFESFREVFGVIPSEQLGMTETNVYVTNPLVEGDLRLGSAGTALPEVEIEIRDPFGRAQPVHTEGEIWVNTPAAMKGYWRDPDRTREVMSEGWVATGDAGHLDEDGYLWYSGRIKQIIICDGDNIHPREVEHEIVRHPRVKQACVVGVPHETRGEVVAAAVILEDRSDVLSAEELTAFLRDRLTGVKIPRSLLILERFPQTANGKLDRKAIVESLVLAPSPSTGGS
jgi:acyl-CoA synthetase (AMP-forming)/AMP-acid ligase II